jgi:hypothetical protein
MWREIDALRYQTVVSCGLSTCKCSCRSRDPTTKSSWCAASLGECRSNAEGGLSERARERALLVAEEADLRIRAPQSFLRELAQGNRDPRLPAVGTCLIREFQGRNVLAEVLEKGFRYEEQVYRLLSAVARQVSGVQWNGYAFFSLPVNVGRRHGA